MDSAPCPFSSVLSVQKRFILAGLVVLDKEVPHNVVDVLDRIVSHQVVWLLKMAPYSQANDLGRIDELEGLRGLLALWVSVSHILCWTGFWDLTPPRPLGSIWREFIGASSAVETFIILSGFAITFLLHKRTVTYGVFMRGRAFRIYPVYLVCLIFGWAATHITPFILRTAQWKDTFYFSWMAPVAVSESSDTGAHVFWHLTLLHGLVPKWLLFDSTSTFLPPAWSVSLEWQYYLLAPFLAVVVRSGVGLLALTGIAALALRYGESWVNGHPAFLPAQLPLFLIGIGSYHLYERLSVHATYSTKFRSALVAAAIGVAYLTKWHTVAVVIWSVGFGCVFVHRDDLFAKALFALRGVLLHSSLQRLGGISFPIYLVHWPIIILFLSLLLHVWPTVSRTQAALLTLCIGLPLILFAAKILHVFVELPFMRLGKRDSRDAAAVRKPV